MGVGVCNESAKYEATTSFLALCSVMKPAHTSTAMWDLNYK
jgi:hypothetical protein